VSRHAKNKSLVFELLDSRAAILNILCVYYWPVRLSSFYPAIHGAYRQQLDEEGQQRQVITFSIFDRQCHQSGHTSTWRRQLCTISEDRSAYIAVHSFNAKCATSLSHTVAAQPSGDSRSPVPATRVKATRTAQYPAAFARAVTSRDGKVVTAAPVAATTVH